MSGEERSRREIWLEQVAQADAASQPALRTPSLRQLRLLALASVAIYACLIGTFWLPFVSFSCEPYTGWFGCGTPFRGQELTGWDLVRSRQPVLLEVSGRGRSPTPRLEATAESLSKVSIVAFAMAAGSTVCSLIALFFLVLWKDNETLVVPWMLLVPGAFTALALSALLTPGAELLGGNITVHRPGYGAALVLSLLGFAADYRLLQVSSFAQTGGPAFANVWLLAGIPLILVATVAGCAA